MEKAPRWTDLEIAALKEYFNEQLPVTEISLKLSRTEGAILSKAKKLGISYGKAARWTAEEEDKLKTLLDSKYSYKKISKLLNRTENAVLARARKLNKHRDNIL